MGKYLSYQEKKMEFEKEVYWNRGFKEGLQAGFDSGWQVGYSKERQIIQRIIPNLFHSGIAVEMIARLANMTISEVEKVLSKTEKTSIDWDAPKGREQY